MPARTSFLLRERRMRHDVAFTAERGRSLASGTVHHIHEFTLGALTALRGLCYDSLPRGGDSMNRIIKALAAVSLVVVGGVLVAVPAQAQTASSGKKPNILVIMGDDIGWYNPSIYHRGDMGYQTPNIDRI